MVGQTVLFIYVYIHISIAPRYMLRACGMLADAPCLLRRYHNPHSTLGFDASRRGKRELKSSRDKNARHQP